MKVDLIANNTNAAPDAQAEARLSFATADEWHDYARDMARAQSPRRAVPANTPEAQS